jgi:hypothetical protein
MSTTTTANGPPSDPPRIVAVSGIVFAALFFASLVLLRLAIPADPKEPGAWLANPALRSWVRVSLNLIPFTGIAFLWFMAVLRNRIGSHEDRLFATVFLGSGLLFIAMLFVSTAIAVATLETFAREGQIPAQSETYAFGRRISYTLMNTYAIKMAAVFIFVTSSIGLRTAFLPRWLAFVGFASGLVMLLVITDFSWIVLLFPLWVLLVSAYILVAELRQERRVETSPKR